MKTVFIINPVSGKTNYELIKKHIREEFKENYEIIETHRPKEATKIARKFYNEVDTIIYSVGGDGTLNEVINGVVGSKCSIGIVPTGSGNDFYKTLKAVSKSQFKIDLGLINKRYFINIASVGLDAQICYNANKLKTKLKLSKIAYDICLIKTFITYKAVDYELKIDDKKLDGKYTIIAICNGKYYGGGFKIAPLSSFDDHYFDVYVADNLNKFKTLKLLMKLLKGTHESDPHMHKYRAQKIEIKAKENMILNIDGETLTTSKIKIEMIPSSLNFNQNQLVVNKIMAKK